MPYSREALADPTRAGAEVALKKACASLEEGLGGRGKLLGVLSHGLGGGADLERLLGMIADPRNDEKNLATICMMAGVTFPQLLVLFRDAGVVKAQLAAMERVWEGLPEVAGDVMARSVAYYETCGVCDGEKVITTTFTPRKTKAEPNPEPKTIVERCSSCRGSGQVVVKPDLERQKIALELGGMLKRGPAEVRVQVNQNGAGGQQLFGAEALRSFRASSDEVLYPRARRRQADPSAEEEVVDVEAQVSEVEPRGGAEEEGTDLSSSAFDPSPAETADGEELT